MSEISTPTISLVLSAPPEQLTIKQYQRLARETDRTNSHLGKDLAFPLLGLFGEVGSLMAELKKKQRDADSYAGYEHSVVEELGDVLWYFSTFSSRANISLTDLANRLNVVSGDAKSSRNGLVEWSFSILQPGITEAPPKPPQAFQDILMRLAGEVGKLVADFSSGHLSDNHDALVNQMTQVLRSLIEASTAANVSLARAAHYNLEKIFDRWPISKVYPPLFDEQFDTDEQLPRRIEMEIFEREVAGKTYVFQRCNGIFIGDRLTDNKLEEDDYRFHDVFHLAYASILGWSPVIRRLFKVKRKSNPKIDESEDGARAALIEEGVSTWIFNHAIRLNYFENLRTVDYGLLKAVRELVKGYEAESCPLWLWEEAVLKGYDVFRQLRKLRRGVVIADLKKRTLTFMEI